MDLGTNLKAEVKGNKLILTADLSKTFGRSGSGKTMKVATTAGFKTVDANGNSAMVSVNINRYPKGDE